MTIEESDSLLKSLKPEQVLLVGKYVFMHPNDVVRVAANLKAGRVNYTDPTHSSGTTNIFAGDPHDVKWELMPEGRSKKVRVREFKVASNG